MQYLVVIEESEAGFGAYVPDLPGCIAAATSRDEVLTLIQEAIEFHIEGMRDHGDPVPRPASTAQIVSVGAA
jgi:predicted RNase H-like HicB family nuclease